MSRSADTVIRFENVGLTRGSRRVFSGLNLELRERRIGLLGDNGAGKSSLLRLINGLLMPDVGIVRVDGQDTVSSRRELPAKVGFVFQNPDHQIVFPTVLEEVAYGFRERGYDRKSADLRAREALRRFGCSDWEGASVHELSEGQKQRLCIVSVAAMEPDILIMDEPFASLDLPTRLDLADFMMSLPQRLLVASHELDLLNLMDRVIWLSDGAVAGGGLPAAVIDRYRQSVLTRRAQPGNVQ